MTGPGGPAVLNPRVERRLRDLEDKMDRLLKELESLKGDKKDKPKRTARSTKKFAKGRGLAAAGSNQYRSRVIS